MHDNADYGKPSALRLPRCKRCEQPSVILWHGRCSRCYLHARRHAVSVPHQQAQDSLRAQIIRVLTLATGHGEYDAADWISRAYFGENTDTAPPRVKPCILPGEPDEEY